MSQELNLGFFLTQNVLAVASLMARRALVEGSRNWGSVEESELQRGTREGIGFQDELIMTTMRRNDIAYIHMNIQNARDYEV